MSVSVGASSFPAHDQDAEALLRDADAALFRAKRMGRSQLALYTPELLEIAAAKFTTEQGLRRAVERGEFELLFQPEVEAATCEVNLVEALLRWRTPDGSLASPGAFLAVAEESGLIMEISDWVMRSAIEAAAAWHRAGHTGLRVAIKFSPRQLLDPGFTEVIRALMGLCRDWGLEMTGEGVERDAQLVLLLGTAHLDLQGYRIARPLPATEVAGFVWHPPDLPARLNVADTGASLVLHAQREERERLATG